MITVISGTNRRHSESTHFAEYYCTHLSQLVAEEVKLLDLEMMAHDWFSPDMYSQELQRPSLVQLQDTYILPAQRMVFFIAEYNGGFPGVVKLFIDAISVRKYRENFSGKKVGIIGIASGRAGNLRGMDHLTSVLHHLGATVLPNLLPISRIETLLSAEGEITDEPTRLLLQQHAQQLVNF